MPEHLLNCTELAQILNLSRKHLYRLMQRGEIPVIRFGRSVRVRPADLEAFIYERSLDYGKSAQAFIRKRIIGKEP
jgi:excisionase family DNA binding protein